MWRRSRRSCRPKGRTESRTATPLKPSAFTLGCWSGCWSLCSWMPTEWIRRTSCTIARPNSILTQNRSGNRWRRIWRRSWRSLPIGRIRFRNNGRTFRSAVSGLLTVQRNRLAHAGLSCPPAAEKRCPPCGLRFTSAGNSRWRRSFMLRRLCRFWSRTVRTFGKLPAPRTFWNITPMCSHRKSRRRNFRRTNCAQRSGMFRCWQPPWCSFCRRYSTEKTPRCAGCTAFAGR